MGLVFNASFPLALFKDHSKSIPSRLPTVRTAYAPMTGLLCSKKPGAFRCEATPLELALAAAVPLPVAVGTVPVPAEPTALSNAAHPDAVVALWTDALPLKLQASARRLCPT